MKKGKYKPSMHHAHWYSKGLPSVDARRETIEWIIENLFYSRLYGYRLPKWYYPMYRWFYDGGPF